MQPHKRMLLVLCLVTVVVVVIILIARGASIRDRDLVGRWVFEGNPNFVTTFNADGTGTHAISWGYGESFQWRVSRDSIIFRHEEQDIRFNFRIDDGALYITDLYHQTFRYLRD